MKILIYVKRKYQLVDVNEEIICKPDNIKLQIVKPGSSIF